MSSVIYTMFDLISKYRCPLLKYKSTFKPITPYWILQGNDIYNYCSGISES